MIIFLIFLFIIILFLFFIRLKLSLDIIINDTKCHFKIKFLMWEFKRKGNFCIKSKEKQTNNMRNKVKKRQTKGLIKNNKAFRIMFQLLKKSRIKKLDIYEEVGVLEPSLTAYAVPIISTFTLLPLNYFDVEWENFKYRINPLYTELKFKLILQTQISFRGIEFIYSIIK